MRIITVLLYLVSIQLFSIAPYYFPLKTNELKNNSIFFKSEFLNLYNFENSNGEKYKDYSYNNIFSSVFELKSLSLYFGYNKSYHNIYANNLDQVEDYIEYEENNDIVSLKIKNEISKYYYSGMILLDNCKYWGSEIDFKYFYSEKQNLGYKISFLPNSFKINYEVNNFSGKIPFFYYSVRNKLDYSHDHFDFTTSYENYIPFNDDIVFYNKVKGYKVNNELEYKDFLNFNINYYFEFANITLDLQYNDQRYGKLDNLQYMVNYLNIEYPIFKNQFIAVGYYGINTEVGKDSFFDIWPFTFWDFFLASRTRLTEFDNNIHMPGFSYSYKKLFNVNSLQIDLLFKAAYNHLFLEDDIICRERYFVFYPFITDYSTNSLNVNNKIDGIVKIDFRSKFKYKNYYALLNFNQVIPLDYIDTKNPERPTSEGGTGTSSSNEVIHQSGGTFLSLTLGYEF